MRIFLFSLFWFIPKVIFSQTGGEAWILPDSMVLYFSSNQSPVVLSSNATAYEAITNLWDTDGNLNLYISSNENSAGSFSYSLFNYQTSERLDSNLQVGSTYTQGAIFLQEDNSQFINLFGLYPYGIYTYSLKRTYIDMDLNAGSGSVVYKNEVLFTDSLTEKMVGIRHSNGIDWWLILRKNWGKEFVTFLIKPDSIRGPFFYECGPYFTNTHNSMGGQMAVSQDGTLLGLVDWGGWISVHNFDRCSGEVSQPIFSYQATGNGFYGCSFSPDGEKFYFSRKPPLTNALYQISLNAVNIQNSLATIFFDSGISPHPNNTWAFGQHKLGPDNKIYISTVFRAGNIVPSSHNYVKSLSIIENPNETGQACNFDIFGFPLPKRTTFALPNTPNYRLGPVSIYQLDSPVLVHHINLGDPVTIGVADTLPNISYLWLSPQFPGWSSNQMLHTTSLQDSALFLYIRTDTAAVYSCNERIDSIWVFVQDCQITTNACPVPPICAGDTAWLCASGDGSYLWSPPYNLHNAASGGTLAWPETTTVYTVTLTLGNGCTATDSVTVIVHQNSAPTFEDTTIRKGEPFGEFFPTADTSIRYHYLNQYGCDSTVYWEVRIDTINSIDNGQLIMDNLRVFPNPVRGVLYVKHTNQNAAFRLYNKLGQVVLEQQNLPPGTAAVSLSGLAEGLYFWEYALLGTGERFFGKTVKVSDK